MMTLNETIKLPDTDKYFIQEKIEIEATIADLIMKKKILDDYLKDQIGEYEKALCGKFTLTLKGQSRATIDYVELVKDHPNIKTENYTNRSHFRVLRILRRGN